MTPETCSSTNSRQESFLALRKKKMQKSKWFTDTYVIREEASSLKPRTPYIKDCKELIILRDDTVQWPKMLP